MSVTISIPPHPWTHIIKVTKHLGLQKTILGEEQAIQAEVREITRRKSGYRNKGSMTLLLPKGEHLPALGVETAVKLNEDAIAEMRRPEITIDKISLNLAMADADSAEGLFSLYLNAHYTSSLTEEHRANMTLRLTDGYVRVKQKFAVAEFKFGSIVVEQEIPQSIQAAMRGSLLSTYVEHSSIDERAVITHVIEQNGEVHIEYDVHSVGLSEVFGSLDQYLHLKSGTNVQVPALKGIS